MCAKVCNRASTKQQIGLRKQSAFRSYLVKILVHTTSNVFRKKDSANSTKEITIIEKQFGKLKQ